MFNWFLPLRQLEYSLRPSGHLWAKSSFWAISRGSLIWANIGWFKSSSNRKTLKKTSKTSSISSRSRSSWSLTSSRTLTYYWSSESLLQKGFKPIFSKCVQLVFATTESYTRSISTAFTNLWPHFSWLFLGIHRYLLLGSENLLEPLFRKLWKFQTQQYSEVKAQRRAWKMQSNSGASGLIRTSFGSSVPAEQYTMN